jgi:mannosyltransferase
VHFTHTVNFDVFRFMRDHGISYGFTESAIGRLDLEVLAPQIKSFIEKNPSLLHQDANIAWLLKDSGREAGIQRQKARGGIIARPLGDYSHTSNAAESYRGCSGSPGTDGKPDRMDDDHTSQLAEAFTAWLVGSCESSLYPAFELGSLAFLRSPGHQALMRHLETSTGTLLGTPVDDVPVYSLSASMFLPKQSVWNFRKKILRHATLQPTPTPASSMPAHTPWHGTPPPQDDVAVAMAMAMEEQFALWDQLAQDMTRQADGPGLKSGNTVIDERNFVLMRGDAGQAA